MALTPCGSRTDQRGMELVRHGTALFPVACYRDDLERDPVPWHWHVELEAALVAEGSALISVGQERFSAKAGEGFFIGSGVLHGARLQGSSGCVIHSAVFHPRLVGGSMDSIFWQRYVQPLLAEGARQLVRLDGSQPWHGGALEAIEGAWESCAGEVPGYELQVRGALSQLAFLLTRHCPAAERPPAERALREEERVKQMLRFIHENLDRPLRTAEIAASAGVSESECLRCFRSVIGTPPVQYLKQLRVQRAAQLLRSTGESAAEIGARCGFQDASYFTKIFRELKGCTPSAYRSRRTKEGGHGKIF